MLAPISYLYQSIVWIRRLFSKPGKLPIPVICCGNLTVGGTGKTILVADLARRLQAQGMTPHILSRGYKAALKGPLRVDTSRFSAREIGDEPHLLSEIAPVWIGSNRFATGRLALDEGADCLILDDGLQNATLLPDIRIVVVEGAMGFGNETLLPAGPLREPIAYRLARTDALVVIGKDGHDIEAKAREAALPMLCADILPGLEIRRLIGVNLIAFAGIGRPEKFFSMLSNAGLRVIRTIAFPDHHIYRPRDCRRLLTLSQQTGVRLVTTQKDAVKLPPALRKNVTVIPVDLRWKDLVALNALIDRVR